MTPEELLKVWEQNAQTNREVARESEKNAEICRHAAEVFDQCVAQLKKALNDRK